MASQEPTSPTPPERLPEAAPPTPPGSPASPLGSAADAGASGEAGTSRFTAGRAAPTGPSASGDPTSTNELPAVAVDPATATTLYESRVAAPGRRRRATGDDKAKVRRRGDTVFWLLGGLCLLGMVVGVTLAAGIIDIQPTAARDDAPPVDRPAATLPATPDLTPTTAAPTRRPTPTPTRTASPTPSPTRDVVPPRRAADRTGALRSLATQLCARAGRGQTGQPLVLQNACDDGDRWRLTQSEGQFSIVHEQSARCLAARDGAATVTLVRCDENEEAQRWRLGIDGTIFAMANVATDQCLDVPAGARINGLVLTQVACNSTQAQSWQLVAD